MNSTNNFCSLNFNMVHVSFYCSKKCALYIKMNTATHTHFSLSIHDNRYAIDAGCPYIATADAPPIFARTPFTERSIQVKVTSTSRSTRFRAFYSYKIVYVFSEYKFPKNCLKVKVIKFSSLRAIFYRKCS